MKKTMSLRGEKEERKFSSKDEGKGSKTGRMKRDERDRVLQIAPSEHTLLQPLKLGVSEVSSIQVGREV